MVILVKILQFVLCLSLLIVFHELGHFAFAKLFKTRVEKFYLFFSPWFSLCKFKRGETEYGIGWLPLGGYVKIAGMIDESMDKEQMERPPQPWEFRSKPAWQRLLMMLGGVIVNVVLAFAIYIFVLFGWGESYLPAENVKYGVVCDSVFHRMGMRDGDIVVGLDGRKVERFADILPDILLNKPKSVRVRRGGETLDLAIPESLAAELLALSTENMYARFIEPRRLMDSTYVAQFADYSVAYDAGMREGDRIWTVDGRRFRFYDEFTSYLATRADSGVEAAILRGADTLRYAFDLGPDGKLGVYFGSREVPDVAVREYSLAEAVPAGIQRGAETVSSYLKQLRLLFSPKVDAYKSVGGMMMLGSIFPGVWDWQIFWSLTAFISIMLAVVNILPIPALDGGHVLFLIYEIVTRRKPSVHFMEVAQMAGMALLLLIFVMANVNDFVRFFG